MFDLLAKTNNNNINFFLNNLIYNLKNRDL